MAELRELFGGVGMAGAVSYLQSGNVVFDSDMADASSLAALLEQALEERFGFPVATLVRSGDEILEVFQANPFTRKDGVDAKMLLVVFLREMPSPQAIEDARSVESGQDEVEVTGREAFLYCPNGYARTRLSTHILERKLDTVATARNWKTVTALAEMVRSRATAPDPSEAL
jgi:uncharacterized protein (DUF1697 family)